jgi:hypothetical protein
MAETFDAKVSVNRAGTAESTIILDANYGNITAGNHGTDGDVILKDGSNVTRIHLDPGNHKIVIRNADNQIIAVLGTNGNLRLGGGSMDADIEMLKGNGQRTMHFDADGGNLWIGGNGCDGDIVLFPSGVGNSNSTADATIHLDANAGDITLSNADCAEDFDIAEGEDARPGMVMVVDEQSKLRCSNQPYDHRVAGVASGAGPLQPGIVFDRHADMENRQPIALAGKVYCRVDASYGQIRVGDLLTTSETAGHAMRVAEPQRALGSVIGKALQPLSQGKDIIPILVALQ